MRDYGKVSPRFWTGGTGKSLRGEMEAQVVALYLMTSPHANMIGVYHLPMLYLAHETGLSLEGASKGLARCVECGFCAYDAEAETVFVIEMAAHQVGDELKANDNRSKSIQKQYEGIAEASIREAFFSRYGSAFCMTSVDNKPLASPLQAPPKPVAVAVAVAVTEAGGEQGASPSTTRKSKSRDITLTDWIETLAGAEAIPADDPIFEWAGKQGIPGDWLGYAWAAFEDRYTGSKADKTYTDWRATFRDHVKRGWLDIWRADARTGTYVLTTAGVQWQKEMAP